MKKNKSLLSRISKQEGFTLLEMLIAIVILGILAAIIIPQITISSDDAKVSAAKSNLAGMRSAVEQYYVQHSQTYPGAKNIAGVATTDAAECATAFVDQLTKYSEAGGKAAADPSGNLTAPVYGPYVKGAALPVNPFTNLATITCDTTTSDITTRTVGGGTGWRFNVKTGVLFANDVGTSGSPAVAHKDY
jgi:prepilin-type N-terminal cleavage/methylation domain-containing protein